MKYIKYFEGFDQLLNIDDELTINDIFLPLGEKYNMIDRNDPKLDMYALSDPSKFNYKFNRSKNGISLRITFPDDYKINDEIKEDINDFKNTLINHGYKITIDVDPWDPKFRFYESSFIFMNFTITK